jgi:hypothetical protein
VGTWIETEADRQAISKRHERGAVNRLLLFVLLLAPMGMASCGAAPASTAISCSVSTSTTSTTTSTSTCTDPTTNISVTIAPAVISVNVATTQLFQDAISGGTNSVTIWQVNGITGGNDTIGRIDSNGEYHAPVTVPSPPTVMVGAKSFEDQNLTATSTVTVVPAPIVTITSPSSPVTIPAGPANTIAFTAQETGSSSDSVLWSVGLVGGLGVPGGNSTFGMISANGVYTAPLTPPISQTVSVTATAADAPNATASLSVTISGYSTSSLQGQYAFSLAGSNSAGHFYRAGSFAADGAGNLTGVLEDINTSTSATTTPISATGSYALGADGRGTLQFNDGLSPASFDFVLANGSQMQFIGFDATGTATGQANLRSASTFVNAPLSALNGTYVFDFAGVDGSHGLSQIGQFGADGAGNITGGSIDINDAGTATQYQIAGTKTVCNPAPTALSTYTAGSNGRGTITLTTLNNSCAPGPTLTLNFYVVSLGSAKFVGTSTTQQVAGYTSQQNPNAQFSVTTLKGNFAFLLAGSAPAGPIATAGSFAADGNGNITGGVLDENLNGTPATALPFQPSGTSAGTYTVASNGRGTATFVTTGRTYSLVFYVGPVGTNTTAVFQETDASITSDGNFTAQQSSPFSLASIAGNYAIATSGVSGATSQTSTGQFGTNGAGLVTTGSIDTNTGGTLTAGQAATGSYTAPAATGRATLTLNSSAPDYAAYVVSPTQVYLVGIQPGQLAAGALLRQF